MTTGPNKGPNYKSPRMRGTDPVIMKESLLTDDHRAICPYFGCGKELHGYELLCGRCFEHQKLVVIDPTKHVTFK